MSRKDSVMPTARPTYRPVNLNETEAGLATALKFGTGGGFMTRAPQHPCPNCPCCEAARECDGCGETLCVSCWAEHNEDAECHSCWAEDTEDAECRLEDGSEESVLREEVKGERPTRVLTFLIPFDAVRTEGDYLGPLSLPPAPPDV